MQVSCSSDRDHTYLRTAPPSCKDRFHGFAFAVDGRVEGALLDIEHRFRAHAHRGEDGGVQVGDRHRVLDRDQRPFVRRGSVKVAFFHAATEHHNT